MFPGAGPSKRAADANELTTDEGQAILCSHAVLRAKRGVTEAMSRARYECSAGGVFVQVHFRKPTDAEWRELLDYILARKSTIKSMIAIVHGDAGPSSKQRAALAEVVKQLPPNAPFAMVTESAIARAGLTAFNWISNRHKVTGAFSPSEVDAALAFLGLSEQERGPVRSLLATLDQEEPRRLSGR
jgi:hypothetical protein